MEFLSKIKGIIKWFIPFGIMEYRRRRRIYQYEELQELQIEKERKIKKYFQSLPRKNIDSELLEIAEYFDGNYFSIFPYDFNKKYVPAEIDVYFDNASKMKYVLHDNKRMYFPRTWDTGRIRDYYNGLCIEQDEDSPHRYETPEYTVKDGDIIADIGAAEGIWALTYAEKAGKIYLFECGKEWTAALKKTFEPWREKVIIVNKYISDTDANGYITLDSFMKGGKISFIKADIEGMELKLLKGGIRTIREADDLKLLLCAYHGKEDAEKIRLFLEAENFTAEHSKRYMLFIYDKELDEPYIRRGIIRAKK